MEKQKSFATSKVLSVSEIIVLGGREKGTLKTSDELQIFAVTLYLNSA